MMSKKKLTYLFVGVILCVVVFKKSLDDFDNDLLGHGVKDKIYQINC